MRGCRLARRVASAGLAASTLNGAVSVLTWATKGCCSVVPKQSLRGRAGRLGWDAAGPSPV